MKKTLLIAIIVGLIRCSNPISLSKEEPRTPWLLATGDGSHITLSVDPAPYTSVSVEVIAYHLHYPNNWQEDTVAFKSTISSKTIFTLDKTYSLDSSDLTYIQKDWDKGVVLTTSTGLIKTLYISGVTDTTINAQGAHTGLPKLRPPLVLTQRLD
jgi:hypothetical protein